MKKILPYKTASEMITIYNIQDLVDNFSIIEKALSLWKSKCEEYKKLHGDEGTSVLGAGIAVYFLPPRCRNYQVKTIISAHKATCCQGASVWESSKNEILSFLKDNGIEAFYEAGNMD